MVSDLARYAALSAHVDALNARIRTMPAGPERDELCRDALAGQALLLDLERQHARS